MSQITELLEVETNPSFDGVRDVLPHEVAEKAKKLHLIDVRRDEEYHGELGHIDGAELITLDRIPDEIDNLPKDETIVFICRSGQRSAQATAFAHGHGFEHVFNLKGGMILWNEKGYPVKK